MNGITMVHNNITIHGLCTGIALLRLVISHSASTLQYKAWAMLYSGVSGRGQHHWRRRSRVKQRSVDQWQIILIDTAVGRVPALP